MYNYVVLHTFNVYVYVHLMEKARMEHKMRHHILPFCQSSRRHTHTHTHNKYSRANPPPLFSIVI